MDLSIGSYHQNSRRSSVATSTVNYYQSTISLAALRDVYRLRSAKTLLHPFKLDTWLVLIAMCTLSIATINLLKYLHIVGYQHRISNKAAMDVLLMALGMSAIYTPRKNGIRILNISWILFSLIIRSIYQGFLFHMIRSHIERSPLDTLDAMLNKDYSTVMSQRVSQSLADYSELQRTNVTVLDSVSESLTLEYLEHLPLKRAKYTVAISPVDFLKYYIQIYRKRRIFTILPEDVMVFKICIYLAKHSYLVDQLDEVLVWIQGSGLIERWKHLQLDVDYFRRSLVEEDELLNLPELQVAFAIVILGLALATLVFMGELLHRFLKDRHVNTDQKSHH